MIISVLYYLSWKSDNINLHSVFEQLSEKNRNIKLKSSTYVNCKRIITYINVVILYGYLVHMHSLTLLLRVILHQIGAIESAREPCVAYSVALWIDPWIVYGAVSDFHPGRYARSSLPTAIHAYDNALYVNIRHNAASLTPCLNLLSAYKAPSML